MVRYLNVKSRKRNEFIDITPRLKEVLKAAEVRSGTCHIFVPHTTAGLTINEGADPSVAQDILGALSGLVPRDNGYGHLEGNADAHIKSSFFGVSLYLAIEEGELLLGTWQSIFFCEFDGPRHRRVALKIISEG